ncbi:hypothetical protein AB0K45_09530, partial [Micrococcus luteus]|uniref:hypothetical protein n=1 Tax=Micrococcus luteus TaxID=1270 RepID=UPI00344104E6
MTTPGGVPNLPTGALTLDTLAFKTQDMTPEAMKTRAVERFPSMMDNSTGLSPASDLTPFGILTKIFAGFNSNVANADPADIQGPDDLPDLLKAFIESLPVVGKFVELLDAVLGDYEGDDPTLLAIRQIFAPIRKLLELFGGVAEGDIPTPEQIGDGFEDLLQNIPGLEDLYEALTGEEDGDLEDIGTWALGVRNSVRDLGQILDIIRGFPTVPANDPISAFQQWVSGLGTRFSNTEGAHQGLLDQLFGGFKQSASSGVGAGDVGNAAGDTALKAGTAMQLGEWTSAIQGLRNNKSLMEGVDETEEANFRTETLFTGSTPAAVISATSAAVPVAYKRFTEEAKKGFITWFGKDAPSDLRIDVYRANYATNTWDHIHTSPNLQSLVDGTWRYLQYSITDLVDRIDVSSGVVLGVAWRVVGAGTHSIAGIPDNTPAHPSIHPRRVVSVRTGVGDLAFGSTAYTPTAQPWFGIGIITGDVPPPYYAPRTTQYATPGSYTYTIPTEFRVLGNLI